jgi:hypothetical protein
MVVSDERKNGKNNRKTKKNSFFYKFFIDFLKEKHHKIKIKTKISENCSKKIV